MSTCIRITGKQVAVAVTVAGLAMVLMIVPDAFGQRPGGGDRGEQGSGGRFSGGGPGGFRGGPGGPGGGFRGGEGGAPSRSRSGGGPSGSSDFLSRMDSNGNGILEPSETSGPAAGFLQRMVDQIPGMDLSRPIPISRLTQEMERLRQQREQGGGNNNRSRGSSTPSGGTEAPVEALVPGFGEFMELPQVPGFGVPLDPWYEKYDDRVVRQVQDFMRRYDESKNGVLDSAEWAGASWRGMDPKKVDTNHDSRINGDELATQYATMAESNSRDRSSSRDRNSDDSQRRRGGDDSGDSRTNFVASMMMRRFDQNGSGSLERDEWGGLGDSASSADRNRDGRISSDELGTFMASRSQSGGSISPFSRSGGGGGDQGGRGGFGRGGDANGGPGGAFGGRGGFARGGDSNGGPGGRGGFGGPGGFRGQDDGGGRGGPGFFGGGGPRGGDASADSGRRGGFFGGRGGSDDDGGDARAAFRSRRGSSQNDDVAETPSSYRFLSPTERLPEGLPSWWSTKDRDGDGQVVMAEYASDWSDARVSEYLQYDVNGDGVITPREAIDAQGRGVRVSPPSGSSSYARSSSPSTRSRPTSTSTVSSSTAPASTSAPASLSDRYMKYAEGIVDKYDTNGDGSLTSDEWSKISKDPSAGDADGNGQITPEEYATWLSAPK